MNRRGARNESKTRSEEEAERVALNGGGCDCAIDGTFPHLQLCASRYVTRSSPEEL